MRYGLCWWSWWCRLAADSTTNDNLRPDQSRPGLRSTVAVAMRSTHDEFQFPDTLLTKVVHTCRRRAGTAKRAPCIRTSATSSVKKKQGCSNVRHRKALTQVNSEQHHLDFPRASVLELAFDLVQDPFLASLIKISHRLATAVGVQPHLEVGGSCYVRFQAGVGAGDTNHGRATLSRLSWSTVKARSG